MMNPRIHISTIAALALAAATTPLLAQSGGSVTVPNSTRPSKPAASTPTPTPTPTAQPGRVELADEPLRLDSVGLTMLVPTNTVVQSTKIGGLSTAQVADKDSRWVINVQTPSASTPQSSVTTAADQTIALIQGSVGVTDPSQTRIVSTEAKLLSRKNFQLTGQNVEQFYLSVPRASGDGRLVKGYTIFKPSASQFVVLELITSEVEFERVRVIYETVAGTTTFADQSLLSESRGTAVAAGAALFARMTPADWDAMLDKQERWQRLSRPAPSGDASDAEELGYRGISFWKGHRGEIDPDRPKDNWSAADRDEGYLARIRVRLLEGKDHVIDSEALYFTAPDRTDESWEVRTYVRSRDGKTAGTWRETGGRANQDVTIQVEETGKPAHIVKPLIQGDGYLGAVECLLLPRVMVRSEAQAEFAFYTYRTQTETISLRRDRLDKVKTPGGGWIVTTTFREGETEQVASYTGAGELIQIDLGDGRMWKPTEVDDLFNLWMRKGLPVNTEPERDRKRSERKKDRERERGDR